MGSAQPFAVLGGSINVLGTTVVGGDIGSYPGAIVGATSTAIHGYIRNGDSTAQAALAAAAARYQCMQNAPCQNNISGQDLGGRTLTPGVYCSSTTIVVSGTVTLDAQGQADAIWI